jgi:hypothetical protein
VWLVGVVFAPDANFEKLGAYVCVLNERGCTLIWTVKSLTTDYYNVHVLVEESGQSNSDAIDTRPLPSLLRVFVNIEKALYQFVPILYFPPNKDFWVC